MKATIIFLLLAQVSWAGPFQQRSIFDVYDLMQADEASGIEPEIPPVYYDGDFEPLGPVCPFRCQCHLRVVQCSDLGEWDAGSLYLPCLLYSWEFSTFSFNHCISKCERQCHLMRSRGSK